MKILGLTGSMGAGKDTVAKILARRGAMVIDADKVAHMLYAPQTAVWREIVKTFGSKILNRGGAINRHKLGEIVFADKKKLRELNRIVHPALKKEVKTIIKNSSLLTAHFSLIVVNAAVLKEIGLVDYVDEVWVVTAPKETRLKRLIKTGLSKQAALRRINSQSSKKDYLKVADRVIRNHGTIRELRKFLAIKHDK
ncbi:dephospho-CoA kinase [candidate division WOR-1 bacterium RIFCSPLOWO2_02_FULL_46_20]|uniref:Dephospho-CoA kinase n=1 Tax=candidate division WOR-1 bacterium RIFCSPLOWO2_02_FULL_46_20 TaxID=1802567 RepID=A0A1F4R425_UNCSA|nr:MAG: dephospho-CoA kinase [candidate division WOR-1 bacterium RIFCSPHIGHO2_02_FULL_45_12]OGC02860.1 MAG: dephospho-CoA kinase [candidate division WOR-1 bacterium RIFCSPLOWO2_02_FULL_46_20]